MMEFDLILESTGEALKSFVDEDGVFNFIVPDCPSPQQFRVVVRVPTIAKAYAHLTVHGEAGSLRFSGASDGNGGSIVTIREHRDNYLAFAATRIDNEVEIDGNGLKEMQLGELAIEVLDNYSTQQVPRTSGSSASSQPVSCVLPSSLKLPEKHKKAMMNAVSIVAAGKVPQAPARASNSNSQFETKRLMRSVGVLRGFYSTAMGHFLRKKLPLDLVHLAIPARRERAEHDEVVVDDDDEAGNAPNKRRLLSSATAKRPKREPKTETQVKPEPGLVAAASSSSSQQAPFTVLEDGVLDLT